MENETTPAEKPERKPRAKAAPKPVRYKLLADVTYDGKNPGLGSVVDDIPEHAAKWFLEQNYIKKED